MLRTAKRTAQRFDPISRLGVLEYVSDKIVPSRVRTMFTTPLPVLPARDTAFLPIDKANGIGTYFLIQRGFVWKPAGSAYGSGSTPGNLKLMTIGSGQIFASPWTAPLQSTDAACVAFQPGAWQNESFAGGGGPGQQYNLLFDQSNPIGDGPPLYYLIFYIRYNLTCPLQLS